MYYITKSLIDSWRYSFKDEKRQEEFVKTLKKYPIEPNELMLAGMKWEKEVERYSAYSLSDLRDMFSETTDKQERNKINAAAYCRGGVWQVRCGTVLPLPLPDYKEVYVKGVIDCLQSNRIIDLKRSKSYDIGKYRDSTQHIIYMLATGIDRFDYLIANGSAGDICVETYNYFPQMKQKLISTICEFLTDIKRKGLNELYEANYTEDGTWEKGE
jgi:hypothetical protein